MGKVGEVFAHKLEISDINPNGCRPHLEYAWHAEGPPVDLKDDQLTGRKGIFENNDKINDLYKKYIDKFKLNPKLFWNITVSF